MIVILSQECGLPRDACEESTRICFFAERAEYAYGWILRDDISQAKCLLRMTEET